MSDSFSFPELQGKAFPSTRHDSFLSLFLQSIYYSKGIQATLIACWQYFPYQSKLSFANKWNQFLLNGTENGSIRRLLDYWLVPRINQKGRFAKQARTKQDILEKWVYIWPSQWAIFINYLKLCYWHLLHWTLMALSSQDFWISCCQLPSPQK